MANEKFWVVHYLVEEPLTVNVEKFQFPLEAVDFMFSEYMFSLRKLTHDGGVNAEKLGYYTDALEQLRSMIDKLPFQCIDDLTLLAKAIKYTYEAYGYGTSFQGQVRCCIIDSTKEGNVTII